jgi:hypothetical protein
MASTSDYLASKFTAVNFELRSALPFVKRPARNPSPSLNILFSKTTDFERIDTNLNAERATQDRFRSKLRRLKTSRYALSCSANFSTGGTKIFWLTPEVGWEKSPRSWGLIRAFTCPNSFKTPAAWRKKVTYQPLYQ